MTVKKQRIQTLLTSSLIQRLLKDYARPYWKLLILASLCMVVVAMASVAPAKLIEPIIDDIFVAKKLIC